MFETKALVVCEDENVVRICSQILRDYGITLTHCQINSADIINMIINNDPHFVVLDTVSSDVNALDIMKSIDLSSLSKKPFFLISADQEDEFARQELKAAGAFSFLPSPLTTSALTESMIQFSQLLATMSQSLSIPTNYLETTVSEIMHKIGVPPNTKGYHFLRTAIMLCVDDAEKFHSVTKVLYPTVAKRHGTTPDRVERAIRHSIEVTWEKGNPDAIHIFFGYRPGSHQKPTNSEFIAMISDNMRVKMNKTI